ncbi:MAG: hypothetical protein AAB418_02950 [candidate division NC10 bacterium]|jgi:hypothetical protein
MTRVRVLSPVGQVRAENFTAPRLPADLTGLTVGFIDNTKHNFDRLADEIGTLLRARYGVGAIVRRRKGNAAVPALAGTLAELAKECDLVFAGSGD